MESQWRHLDALGQALDAVQAGRLGPATPDKGLGPFIFLVATLFCATAHAEIFFRSGFESGEPPAPTEHCSGVAEALELGIEKPTPPLPTSLPGNACIANSTASLQQHVDDANCTDIVLQPGIYPPEGLQTSYLFFKRRTRLWAENPGEVVLRFGISLGANSDHPADFDGSELHGLVIDIDDPEHGVPFPPSQRAAIMFWGKSRNVRIHDSIIRGHSLLQRGIYAAQPNGLDIQRVEIEGFLRFGLHVTWTTHDADANVRDIVVRQIGDPAWQQSPQYLPGTEEHGIWLGFPTNVERARIRDVYWSGILTAAYSANNSAMRVEGVNLSHIDIDRIGDDHPQGAGAGVGFERITHDLTLSQFCIGPQTQRGVHAEWNHYDPAQSARNLQIGNGVISSAYAGINLDYGTLHTHLHDLHIRNARWAGVGMYHNYLDEECDLPPSEPPSSELCGTTTWSQLTFDLPTELPSCELSFSHYLTNPALCLEP